MSCREKRCIFHIPNHLEESGVSGSQIRPKKMIQAFRNVGYQVDVVMGYAEQRKTEIENIKKNIESGVKYDFMYCESSTMPTLLTEKNHIPKHFGLDFKFFKFCKCHDIPIGLFYRDIYWRFPIYKNNVSGLKYYLAQMAYRYDLYKYSNLLDIIYLPSYGMKKYLKNKKLDKISRELPPAASLSQGIIEYKKKFFLDKKNHCLNLFYVGGIGEQYKFNKLLKGIYDLDFVKLTICCRQNEWLQNKDKYEQYLNDRINIVHESGEK